MMSFDNSLDELASIEGDDMKAAEFWAKPKQMKLRKASSSRHINVLENFTSIMY